MLMKKRLAVLLLAAAVILSYTNSYAYTYYDISEILSSDDCRLSTDSLGGIYISGLNGNDFEIAYINSGSESDFLFDTYGLKLEAFSGSLGVGGAVFSGTDVRQDGVSLSQLQVLTCDFDSNFSDVNTVNATIGGESCFALGKDGYYIIQDDHRTIKAYSLNGVFRFSVYAFNPVYQLVYDGAADCLYAAYDCGVYLLDGKSLYDLGEIKTPVSLSGKAALTGSDGKVYIINGRKMNYLCSVQGESCAVINNRVYYSNGGALYSKSGDGEAIASIDMGGNISRVFACGGQIGTLTDGMEMSFVSPNEMTSVVKPTSPASSSSDAQSGSNTGSAPSAAAGVFSSVYTIDNSRMTITDIIPQTTIAVFKSNIDYGGYKISFKNYDGKARTSGNVGTGFSAEFYGADSRNYTLIVRGDLTGEGNINSLDVKKYMQYLCGKAELYYPFDQALDINCDGQCDVLDLLIAAKK